MSAAAGLLQGFHAVIAMRRGPHWLLSDQDARQYGLALSNALRHLPVTMAQKWIDFSALALAVVAYEGPRIGEDIRLRQARGRPAAARGPAQVFQFRPSAPSPPSPSGSQGPVTSNGVPPPGNGVVPPTGPPGDMTYEPEWETLA